MDNLNEKNITIDVPYFKQTRYSTCGAASLMMVLKYWDKNFELSQGNEFLIWVKSNPFIFLGGALQFGLAKTALKLGYNPEIYQKTKFSNIYKNKSVLFDFYEWIASFGARFNKIPILYNKNIFDEIIKSLNEKIPPLVFLNLKPVIGENVLHWLVVTGFDGENVIVNDPYVPNGSVINQKKDFHISLDVFKSALATDKSIGLRLPPCIIKIYKK